MAPVIYTTDRLIVHYVTTRLEHDVNFFMRDGANQAQFIAGVRDFLVAIAPIIFASTTFDSARYQTAGTNFSLPITWDPISGSAAGTLPRELEAIFIGFRARSTAGRQTYIDLYAPALPLTDNYRYTAGEDPVVDAAIAAWNSLGGVVGDNQGNPRVIYSYANMGVDAYVQRKLRNP